MDRYVLDTSAVFVFLNREKGFARVKTLLENQSKDKQELYLSLLSLGEIYYILIREVGEAEAASIIAKIESLDLHIVEVDTTLTKTSAKIKAKGGLSFTDSLVIATAIKYKAKVITGDQEFKKFAKQVEIEWV